MLTISRHRMASGAPIFCLPTSARPASARYRWCLSPTVSGAASDGTWSGPTARNRWCLSPTVCLCHPPFASWVSTVPVTDRLRCLSPIVVPIVGSISMGGNTGRDHVDHVPSLNGLESSHFLLAILRATVECAQSTVSVTDRSDRLPGA